MADTIFNVDKKIVGNKRIGDWFDFESEILPHISWWQGEDDGADTDALGATLTDTNKWQGGVLGKDGKIYGIPRNSTDILIIDTDTGTATRSDMGAALTDTTKWLGGVLGKDGKIYGIPRGSNDILIIDTDAGIATRSDMGATLTDTNKWYGGVLGKDGKIYGIPRNSTDILIIDTSNGIGGDFNTILQPYFNKL